jgi:hypothetical protein
LDDEEDYALEVWAGVVPLVLERKEPLPDEAMKGKIPIPKYLK